MRTEVPISVDFDNPPVMETVIGFKFLELEGWSIYALGALWQEYRSRYPKSSVKPPLGVPRESSLMIDAESLDNYPVRCWFQNPNESQLIQVQNNCFLYNWRKYVTDESYPRYHEKIRGQFQQEWEIFSRFLRNQKLQPPAVQQCELTYVNHLEEGREWNDWNDLGKILTYWGSLPQDSLISSASSIAIQSIHELEENNGKLIIELQPAIRQLDEKKVMQLRITVVSEPTSSDILSLMQCIDAAHENLIAGFRAVTTAEVQSVWGIKE